MWAYDLLGLVKCDAHAHSCLSYSTGAGGCTAAGPTATLMYRARSIGLWPDGHMRWFLINPDRTMGTLQYTEPAAFDASTRVWYTGTVSSVGAGYSAAYTSATVGMWVNSYTIPLFSSTGVTAPLFGVASGTHRVDGNRLFKSCTNGCRSGSSGSRGAVQGAVEIVNTRVTSFGAFDIVSQDGVRAVASALYDTWMNTRASDRADSIFYASARSYVGLVPCILSPTRPDCLAVVSAGWGTTTVVMEVASDGARGACMRVRALS